MIVVSTLSPLFFRKKPFESLVVHVLYDVLGAQTHRSHFDGKSLKKVSTSCIFFNTNSLGVVDF